MSNRWLLADVGGTNTRVGLAEAGRLIDASQHKIPNRNFGSLEALLARYLKEMSAHPVQAVCAGVAGPVRGAHAQLTNHRWEIAADTLRQTTGAPHVRLINDIQAQGLALDDLPAHGLTPLFAGAQVPSSAARLVMGLGTGSNVAVVHRVGTDLFVPPAESGHARLPYVEGELGALIRHVGAAQSHHPMEGALSGPGLQRIEQFLGGPGREPSQIVAAAQIGEPVAAKAIALFSELLGHVAGDLALAHLPMGGLFLFGGVARGIAPFLAHSAFYASFTAKGPYESLLRDIPIFLIEDDRAALRGCARYLQAAFS